MLSNDFWKGTIWQIIAQDRQKEMKDGIFDEDECVSYQQLTANPRVLYDLYTTPALPFMVLDFSTPCQQQFAIWLPFSGHF